MTPAEHRAALFQLVALAASDLRGLFTEDAERTRDRLTVILPELIMVYGAAAASLGADVYDELRDAANPRRRFTVDPAEPPDPERGRIMARWGTGPLFDADPDPATAYTKTLGGLHRTIADLDRNTITTASIADREARGWRRSTSGGCKWCQDMSRIVFTRDDKFASHDGCGCLPVPVFR